MKKIIGVVLIVAGLVLLYTGYNKYEESTGSLSIGELELSSTDKEGRNMAFVMFGGAFISLFAGGMILKKS
ncbi:DUF3185 family protein [Mangrovivirga sp. M17]|uniref:DUF3185 domain-containing protein n=2 Tax=Mangrovivirga TaxID=2858886 RepID=A0A4D7JP95_9BACT|nr:MULTISPECIES: DUF3185 family protein [Mangrovivirga]MCX2744016.1 DUF3185 family protein [Mangrovivirga halotolerans]QCK15320.1 hypothetical protein DCC35_11475 [Mangrovivirga cuniculi]